MATARMSLCPVPVALQASPSGSSTSSSSSPSAPSCSSSPSCGRGAQISFPAGISRTTFLGSQLPVLCSLRQGEKDGFHSRGLVVHAEYSRRSGGGAGDFMAGFLLGGVLFGTVGYLLAPMISKSIATVKEMQEDEEIEGPPKRLPRFIEEEDGLEGTRKSLNEKIAQLNAAIDDVSAQLRADDGSYGLHEPPVELESAA